MSQVYKYRTSDVFTDKPYTGNQLGIVSIPFDKPLSQSDKQRIANEFNYSETIFVHEPETYPAVTDSPASTPHIKVDIFTTDAELPFAGHPTIGAIHHILTHIFPDRDDVVVDLKAGHVIGTMDRTTGYASAEIPQEFHRHSKIPSWDDVVASQPTMKDGKAQEAKHALVSIVREMNFALVDLSSDRELLKRVKVTPSNVAHGKDLDEGWPDSLIANVFYVEKPDQGDGVWRYDQRVVVIGLEDPATGSASCALTGYLALEKGGNSAVHKFELVQGEQMGRRSVITTEVTLDDSGRKIKKIIMSGQCKGVMKGELEI